MLAADIMTQPVFAIDPAAPLLQAIRMMIDNKVSGLPVADAQGQVLGMLTEGDLLRRVETGTEGDKPGWLSAFLFPGRDAETFVKTHARRVDEVMTSGVIGVTPDTPLADVVALMLKNHIKRVPVLRDGRLLGMVSRADVVARLGEALATPVVSADDATLRQDILDAMDKEPWSPRVSITIDVTDGVASLDGCVFDIRVRDAAGVVAETTPGVRRVENRIVCIEPYSGMITYDPQENLNPPR